MPKVSEIAEKNPDELPPMDFSQDMLEIEEEMQRLKQMQMEMHAQTKAESEKRHDSPWKTPEVQRLLGKQLEEETMKMG